MEFMSTNLPHNISHGLYQEKGYDVAEAHIDKLFYITMFGVANVLKDLKDVSCPTAFTITTMKKPIAAAIVEYFDNKSNDPGNWSLVWTFNPDDIPENVKVINLKDPDTHSYFRMIAGEKYGMKFTDTTAIVTLISYCMEQLYKWLDENAKEGETVEIELDGIFNAKVEIENGVKIFAIDPAGEVKTVIKDDSALEAVSKVKENVIVN